LLSSPILDISYNRSDISLTR